MAVYLLISIFRYCSIFKLRTIPYDLIMTESRNKSSSLCHTTTQDSRCKKPPATMYTTFIHLYASESVLRVELTAYASLCNQNYVSIELLSPTTPVTLYNQTVESLTSYIPLISYKSISIPFSYPKITLCIFKPKTKNIR